MKIEVWSDVACPWCYIGKRRLEQALASFDAADQVTVEWRSYQLDPAFPVGVAEPEREMLARKFGAPEGQLRQMVDRVVGEAATVGLHYDYDRMLAVNTFDAHRMLQLGKDRGRGGEVKERLLRAHFLAGESLADHETLTRLGADAGLPADEVRKVLAAGDYGDAVRADLEEAQRLGVRGVPFFVLDRRYGLSGAQPVETFLTALRRAHAEVG